MDCPSGNIRSRRRGFTLIEAAITTVIIGVGVVSLMSLIGAGTQSNAETAKLTTAIQLANTIRDLTLSLDFIDPQTPAATFGPDTGESLTGANPYDDVDDFHNAVFSPPIDARRQTLDDYPNWSQAITVETINPLDLDASTPVEPGTTEMNRVTVRIRQNGREIHRQSWIMVYASD